jgi:hypothetical protein
MASRLLKYFKNIITARLVSLCLISCIAPCLFIIPVFCSPIEMSISQEQDFCPLVAFTVTSDTLILSENIDIHTMPQEFTFLMHKSAVFNLSVVSSEIDKPPLNSI